jgi:hypothetical protein
MRVPLLALGLAFLGFLAPQTGARAESVRTVMELFTSQGCSSCPPADRLAGELAQQDGVLLLSFPVDYWDYLGWKDTLAHSSFTRRQKQYAYARRDRQVYTPQMVINGASHVVGSDREAITAAEVALGSLPITLSIEKKGGAFTVNIPAAATETPAAVFLLPIQKTRLVEIGRGENSGATVTYVNVVRGLSRIGDWQGAASRIAVPSALLKGEGNDAEAFAIVLQSLDNKALGPILGAARSPDY